PDPAALQADPRKASPVLEERPQNSIRRTENIGVGHESRISARHKALPALMGMTVEQERIPLLAELAEEGNVTSWTDTSPGSVRRSKTPHRAGSGYVPALHGNTGTGAVRP